MQASSMPLQHRRLYSNVGLYCQKKSQQIKMRYYLSLLSTCYTVFRILCSVGSPNTEKTLANWSEFSRGPPAWSGLEHLPCEERLRDWGWFKLATRQLQGHLTAVPQYLWGYPVNRATLITVVHKGKTPVIKRSEKHTLNAGRNVFTLRAAMHWIRLTRQAAQAAYGGFRDWKAKGNLIWPYSWPCLEQKPGPETSWDPSQAQLSIL